MCVYIYMYTNEQHAKTIATIFWRLIRSLQQKNKKHIYIYIYIYLVRTPAILAQELDALQHFVATILGSCGFQRLQRRLSLLTRSTTSFPFSSASSSLHLYCCFDLLRFNNQTFRVALRAECISYWLLGPKLLHPICTCLHSESPTT